MEYKKPHSAAIAYQIENGDYLVVKSLESGKWSFPKGRIEPDDNKIIDTAIREFREETGVTLIPGKNCKILNRDKKPYSIRETYLFNVQGSKRLIEQQAYNDPIKGTNNEIEKIMFLPRSAIEKGTYNGEGLVFNSVVNLFFGVPPANRNLDMIINDAVIIMDLSDMKFLVQRNTGGYVVFPSTRTMKDKKSKRKIMFPLNVIKQKLPDTDQYLLNRLTWKTPPVIVAANNRHAVLFVDGREKQVPNLTKDYEWIKVGDLQPQEDYPRRLMLEVVTMALQQKDTWLSQDSEDVTTAMTRSYSS